MSCEIKNEKRPVQIQCSFPTAATDTRPFSLYFYSSEGSQELVVGCAYNAGSKCFYKDGFNASHDGYNAVTITVPDTFSTTTGEFGCQKGDIPMVTNCLYPPPDIQSSSTTEQFGNEGNNPAVPVAAIVVPIVIVVIIIIIGCLLFFKCRSKSRESRKKTTKYSVCPLTTFTREKGKQSFSGIKNTGNHVDRKQTDRASEGFMKRILSKTFPGRVKKVSTVD